MQIVVRSFWVLAAAALFGDAAQALDIPYQFDPNRHNRFLSGFGTNPVQNPNVLGLPGLNFSGVGWGSNDPSAPGGPEDWRSINVAMVTPRHFIVANHNKPREGTAVNFLGTDGVVRSYPIQNYIPLNFNPNDPTSNHSDLIIGQLGTAIQPSDNIAIYPVVRPGPFAYPVENSPPEYIDFYRGREVVVVGKNEVGGADADGDGYNDRGGKIAKNIFDDVFNFNFGTNQTNTVGYGYFTTPNTPDAGQLVQGDSGSPSFLLYNGQLTALGSHSGVGTFNGMPYNVDSFLPYYVDQINSLIQNTGFQITVITPVPEPGAVVLVGIVGAGFAFRRWRRRVVA